MQTMGPSFLLPSNKSPSIQFNKRLPPPFLFSKQTDLPNKNWSFFVSSQIPSAIILSNIVFSTKLDQSNLLSSWCWARCLVLVQFENNKKWQYWKFYLQPSNLLGEVKQHKVKLMTPCNNAMQSRIILSVFTV